MLAICATLFFAFVYGLPQKIWQTDVSKMTSLLAALLVGSSFYLGWLAWNLSPSTAASIEKKADFGWWIEEKFLRLGLLGTVFGLSLQAETLATGTVGFAPISTAFYSTMVGVTCSLIIAFMNRNLQTGIERVNA
jgi:hypothetical protein